jgi:minor extracellular protease Epr
MPRTSLRIAHRRRPALAALAALACLGIPGAAFAQLPDLLDNQITRRVEESVAGQVVRRVEDSVEKTVQSAVDRAIDSQLAQAIDRTLEATLVPIANGVLEGLDRITGRLPLPQLPLREITVEDGWRAIDHEWVALIAPADVQRLQQANVRVMEATPLEASGLVMVRVVVSDEDNTAARAQQLLRSLGATAADRNHIYDEQANPLPESPSPKAPAPAPVPQPTSSRNTPVIGLIDTALNRNHPALASASIVDRDFVAAGRVRPTAHGTGIASLLVGAEISHPGLLPNGRLFAASVFHQGESGANGATTSSLVSALDWMAAQKVQVVNMSLAGPPNEVLGAMIGAQSKRGMLVVAAVGNDGPAARALYPAAFEPVVAVTAIDRSRKIYRWANQGPQVDVAAWGVASKVARDKGGYGEESGTSYAAPIVAAALAQTLAGGAKSTSAALKAIIASAEDLGPRGRDNTFGHGLVKLASQ